MTCASPLGHLLPTDQLYTFIRRQAWDSLDEIAQRTLLVMPLAPPQGMTTDLLAQISGLNSADLLNSSYWLMIGNPG